MAKLETRNSTMSHRGIHFEVKHEGIWKRVSVGSKSVTVHDAELPEEMKQMILEKINAQFTDSPLP